MSRKVYVIGVGLTRFVKPGENKRLDYPQMGKEAVEKALDDAKISYKDIEHASVGYVYGDSACGQKVLYQIGMTGIPIINVNNNCATGSTALYLSKRLVEGGLVQCALALGFEKMSRGSLTSKFTDRTNPMQTHLDLYDELYGIQNAPVTAQLFGQAGKEHMDKYGTKMEHFAKIAYKNHKHSKNNPYAQFRDEHSLQEIMSATTVSDCISLLSLLSHHTLHFLHHLSNQVVCPPLIFISNEQVSSLSFFLLLFKVFDLLTKYQCCPTSDGAGAAVLASEEFVRKHGLESQAVEILAMEMTTDPPSSFESRSAIQLVGFDMSRSAAEAAYRKAGVSVSDVQVVELHDCFSSNELITYEALGLCPVGKAGQFIDAGDNTYGGKYVVNPSGGLLSKGHPLGATGLAQCSELCWQLRGEAGPRQVAGAKLALQHNIGLGGAVVVAIYRHGFPDKSKSNPSNIPALPSKL